MQDHLATVDGAHGVSEEYESLRKVIEEVGEDIKKIREVVSSQTARKLSREITSIKQKAKVLEGLRLHEMRKAAGDAEELSRKFKERIGELKGIVFRLRERIGILESPPLGRATFVRFVRMEKFSGGDENREYPLIEVRDVSGHYAWVYFLPQTKEGKMPPDVKSLVYGQQLVVLGASGQASHVVEVLDEVICSGVEASVVELLTPDSESARALVRFGERDELHVVRPHEGVPWDKISEASRVLVDIAMGHIIEVLPEREKKKLLVDEIPDVTFEDVGGLENIKKRIKHKLARPFKSAGIAKKLGLPLPKGFVLAGAPGNGKTMIAKACFNFIRDLIREKHGAEVRGNFMVINGPELLHWYVGRTEHDLREIFSEARKKASPTNPVVIFMDEADAFLRPRGRVISSDVHETHVPQFNALMDGLEELGFVIVILATNRRDLLDPAAIRPGRFDQVFTIPSPDKDSAREIFKLYLKPEHVHPKYLVPVYIPQDRHGKPRTDSKTGEIIRFKWGKDPKPALEYLVDKAIARIYDPNDSRNRFLRVTFRGRTDPVQYCYSDFCSGARIKNIIDRSKEQAAERAESEGSGEKGAGVMLSDLYTSIEEVFLELKGQSAHREIQNWLATEGHDDLGHIEKVEFSGSTATLGADDDD